MDITSIIKSGALILCLLLVGCDKAEIGNDTGDNVTITAPEQANVGEAVTLTATLYGNLDASKATFVWEDESIVNLGLASSSNTAHFIAPANLDTANIKVTVTYENRIFTDSASVFLYDPVITPISSYNIDIDGPTAATSGDKVILNGVFTKDSLVISDASLSWSQSNGPDVVTTDVDGGISFVAPIVTTDTNIVFAIESTDEEGVSRDTIRTVTIKPTAINFINTVDTGVGQVTPGDKVTLTSQAQSTGGGTLEYNWEQTGGATVNITDSSSQTTDFVAPALPGDLTFKVTVTDQTSGKSTTQTQKFSVKAPALVAQKGADHIIYNNHGPVKLNARVSGGTAPFSYLWTQTKGPSASLSSNTVASPTVTPPPVSVETLFEWDVTVTDGSGLQVTTTHSITVSAVNTLKASINGAIGSAPIIVTEGDTVHPAVSITGGTGTYAVQWSSGNANVVINDANTTTPNFVLPDITNTQGHDETLYLSVVVSDGSIDGQGTPITVTAMATFTIKPAFIVSLHQNQQGSSGATNPSVATNQKIQVASQKNLHPVVDIAENTVSDGTYAYQWSIVKPNPAPSDLSIAGADQLHPILSMPLVTSDTPLELSLVTTYTATSGKAYTVNRTLNYLIEPPAAPSKQLLSLSTGGHISVLSGHAIHPTVSALNASGALTYKWNQISGPDISSTLTGETTKAPTFTAPPVTGHQDVVLEVTVSDGTATETAQVTFTIDPLFIPTSIPIAVTAGNYLTVALASTVNPTATVLNSFGAFTYAWSQKSGEPLTSTGGLTDATTATPSFVVPNAPGKQVELEVTVTRTSDSSTASDTVIYTLQGAIEITAGNATQSIGEGSVLDLVASTKNAAGAVTYAWTVLDANGLTLPAITDADKSQATIAMPAVTAETVIKIQVEANDTVNTVKTEIAVTVKNLTLQVNAGTGYDVPPSEPAYLHGSVTGGLAPYTYAWTAITATPANPTLTGATSANPSLTAPTAAQSTGMQYELTVTDSLGNLAKNTVTLKVVAPTFSVDAGENLVLIEKAWGSVLAKAENKVGTLTWAWSQIIPPGGSTITFTDATSQNPWFQAPDLVAGTQEELVFEVAATDATSGKTETDQVKVLVFSVADVFANAGATYVVNAGETVTLDGLATGVGTVTQLTWRADSSNSHTIGAMTGANSIGSSPGNSLTATFAAPVVAADTTLYFNFTATGTGNIDVKRVAVIVKYNPSAVQVGPDRSAVVGETVHLSAVAPAGSTFAWTQTLGTPVTLDDANIATPKFLVDAAALGQELEFQVVSSLGSTTTDTVKIRILEPKVRITVPNRLVFEEGDVSKNPIVARINYFNKNTTTLVTPTAVTKTVTPASAAAKFSFNTPSAAPDNLEFSQLEINPTGLAAGEYQIYLVAKVTGNAADDGTETIHVTVTKPPGPPLPKNIDLSHNPVLTALPGTAQSFSLNVPAITGGTPPLTYAWSLPANPHGITVADAATDNPTVSFPAVPNTCTAIEGDITLTVTDAAGGSTTSTIHYKNNPAATAMKPISCNLCTGPKFICERNAHPTACSKPEHQYCINDVENLIDGSRYVTRRCATAEEVNHDWFGPASSAQGVDNSIANGRAGNERHECKVYFVGNLIASHYFCSFPCKGDNCNAETVPGGTPLGIAGSLVLTQPEPPTPKPGVCP